MPGLSCRVLAHTTLTVSLSGVIEIGQIFQNDSESGIKGVKMTGTQREWKKEREKERKRN